MVVNGAADLKIVVIPGGGYSEETPYAVSIEGGDAVTRFQPSTAE